MISRLSRDNVLSALCHIAVEIFWGDKSAIYRTKITFPLYCKSPQFSVSPVKCAKVICCSALGCFLYDYKIDLNLTPSLGHFLFHCGTNDAHINHEAHLFVWSIEVILVKKPFPLVYTK